MEESDPVPSPSQPIPKSPENSLRRPGGLEFMKRVEQRLSAAMWHHRKESIFTHEETRRETVRMSKVRDVSVSLTPDFLGPGPGT